MVGYAIAVKACGGDAFTVMRALWRDVAWQCVAMVWSLKLWRKNTPVFQTRWACELLDPCAVISSIDRGCSATDERTSSHAPRRHHNSRSP
jgi:hypothetical protein